MSRSPSRCRVPLDDTSVRRVGMAEAEAAEIVPGDAARAAVVARDLRPDLLRDADRLGAGVAAEEVGPGRQAVGPRLRHAAPGIPGGGVRRTALRNEGLLEEPA